MAYRDFTNLNKVRNDLNLQIKEQTDLFAEVTPLPPSESLLTTLKETVPLALAINTEKARSELIVTPLLLELRRQAQAQISLFSGNDFNVDVEKGLNGYCDFIISRSPEQLTIVAPVAVIVEAKNENIKAGLGQCIAALFASQLFNQQQGKEIDSIYGAVTTGDIWRFLQLAGNQVAIDLSNFYIQDVQKILGILSQAVRSA